VIDAVLVSFRTPGACWLEAITLDRHQPPASDGNVSVDITAVHTFRFRARHWTQAFFTFLLGLVASMEGVNCQYDMDKTSEQAIGGAVLVYTFTIVHWKVNRVP
jgi:hypothetical protein